MHVKVYLQLYGRLAPSLCISYSTKSDIHGIIMNPYNTKTYLKCVNHNLVKKSFNPYIMPNTKGLAAQPKPVH